MLLALAIGSSTRQTYTSGINSYLAFIDRLQIPPAFPASVQTLCLWLDGHHLAAALADAGHLQGVPGLCHHAARRARLDNPIANAPPMLDRLIAGIKRLTAQPGRQKLPITTAMLGAMRPHLRAQRRSDSLLWAMMWTATAGLLRISEFTVRNDADTARMLHAHHLTLHDQHGAAFTLEEAVAAEPAPRVQHATLHLDASKTDPFRSGVDIIIAAPSAIKAASAARYLSVLVMMNLSSDSVETGKLSQYLDDVHCIIFSHPVGEEVREV
jgi:hypothetical protein